MHPILTIFCPFTRRWAVDDWLKNLEGVAHDPALTNLCFIIDTEELYIANILKQFSERRGYRSFHSKMNTGHHPNEVRLSIRRQRVAEIHEQAKELIAQCDGDIVICMEDDTVFDRLESFERLYDPLQNEQVGFVEGVQMGRWGANMIGAWLANDIENPTQIETLLPMETDPDYQHITGGGWYGYATRKTLFLNAPYFTSPSYPWGPDVNYGFWVCRQGLECLVDWKTVYGHNDHGITKYPDDPKIRLAKIVYNKNEANGKWQREDYEPTRF